MENRELNQKIEHRGYPIYPAARRPSQLINENVPINPAAGRPQTTTNNPGNGQSGSNQSGASSQGGSQGKK